MVDKIFRAMRSLWRGGSSLRRVGYWYGGSLDTMRLPDPWKFVDPYWDKTERAQVVRYLRAGRVAERYFGTSWCRMGCPDTGQMGSADLTDGVWIWPEGLVHYVEHHEVKPDADFVRHALRSGR